MKFTKRDPVLFLMDVFQSSESLRSWHSILKNDTPAFTSSNCQQIDSSLVVKGKDEMSKGRKTQNFRLKGILEILICFTILIYSFSLACCVNLSELPRSVHVLNNLLILFQDNLLNYSNSFLECFLCSRVDVEGKAMNEMFLELLAQCIQKGLYLLIFLLAAQTPLLKSFPDSLLVKNREGQ